LKIPINTPIFGKKEIDAVKAILLEKSLAILQQVCKACCYWMGC